ncbi:hypothetical protein C8T65DRAFT_825680, partial [Cerioporus squamosus]
MRVPVEVMEKVIDLGSLNPDEDAAVYPTLLAWSLTCRACTIRSCLNLYRHVIIRSPTQMTRFVDVLSERPHLARVVCEMTIALQTSPYTPFGMHLRRLTGLKSVTLGIDWFKYPPSYARNMSCFAGTKHLHLQGTTLRGLPDLRSLLRGFPMLRELVLDSIKFTDPRLKDASRDISTVMYTATPTLRTMRIQSYVGLEFAFDGTGRSWILNPGKIAALRSSSSPVWPAMQSRGRPMFYGICSRSRKSHHCLSSCGPRFVLLCLAGCHTWRMQHASRCAYSICSLTVVDARASLACRSQHRDAVQQLENPLLTSHNTARAEVHQDCRHEHGSFRQHWSTARDRPY